ncbi:hypothetical protein EVAR_82958_1 [Eumeta japonica]|uniref:Uncharacterized protein n=1 Tax=Eumeta variegata TaxID=151549 RepID=A0A4C1VPF5_EUMVA|nr:hypothetical protein EVAR_82958_1 [Eumeta japonica]
MIDLWIGQHLQGKRVFIKYIDQLVSTISYLPYRSLSLDHLRLKDRAEGIESECRLTRLLSVAPIGQSRIDFAHNTVAVGIFAAPLWRGGRRSEIVDPRHSRNRFRARVRGTLLSTEWQQVILPPLQRYTLAQPHFSLTNLMPLTLVQCGY